MMDVFKRGPLPTLVAVVTTKYNGVVNAAPVTWFTPCSYDPPLLFVALKREKDTLKNIVETGEFVLQTVPFKNVQSVHNLARNLPRDESEVEYEGLDVVESSKIDVPRLTIAVQWFECRVDPLTIHTWGKTHAQVIASVLNEDVRALEKSWHEELPLLYFGGLKYARSLRSIEVEPY